MNDSNSSNQSNSQNIDNFSLAKGIYELLGINKELESEEDLFSDEVYIEIITKIIPDIQEEISPGNTPEEKVETIKILLSLLGNLVEANLSKINAKKIVIEHDKESVKNFLELLLQLINVIINNGEEEFEEDEENMMDKLDKHNISDGNLNKKKIKSNSFDEDKKLNNFNKEEEVNIDDIESLKLSRDKKNDKNKKDDKNKKENEKEKENEIENEESEEMKMDGNFVLDKEKSQSEENFIIDKENKSNSKEINVSHITDEIKDVKKETDKEEVNISNENENEVNSNKKSYDIPALLENDDEKDKNHKKEKSIDNELNNQYIDNDEEEISPKNIKFEENKYNFQGSEDDLSSNNLKESAYSVPQPFNKPLLTNNSSEDFGNSLLKKEKEKEKEKNKNKNINKNDDDKDEDDFDLNYNDELDEKNLNLNLDKNSNNSLLNSNISLHSKKSKKSNRINDSKLQESSNKKGSSKKKESVIGGNKVAKNLSNKKGSRDTNKSKNENENENEISESQSNDISKSSVYTIHEGSAISSHKNSKISKKSEKNNLNKSKNSKKSSIKEKTRSSSSTIINSEIPLDDKGFKFELIKELKKIYGNKIGKVLQGPNNSYSNLDLILQDLKMVKKQEKKMRREMQQNSENKDKDKNSIDKNSEINEDALLNKEFLIKNEKQLQLMLQIYNQKLKKKQLEQEKYIKDIGQNVQFMRKIRDLELKKIENEIERKKNMYKNNTPESIYFCQKIYENYYQLEAEKCAKEIDSIKMINDMKLKEKTKNIYDIDRYYSDKIAILNEIGRRERKENKKSKMEDELIYYQLKSMPKKDLKRKMKQIINSLDDNLYNNIEVDNNNQEEIEKIIDNYYKK